MPDIASALRQALDSWEPPAAAPEPTPAKPYFTVTNNVTRVTFDYVRDNPGKTRVEVAAALEKMGYKPGSVSSLLGQMIQQGMVRESRNLLYVTVNEYTPIKSSKIRKALATKPQEQQRKKVVLVSKRTGEVIPTAPVAEPTPVVKEWSPNDVIDKLTVHQAIALFKALRSVLVG
jgi:DNA-binding MarR family transcriptional regulator